MTNANKENKTRNKAWSTHSDTDLRLKRDKYNFKRLIQPLSCSTIYMDENMIQLKGRDSPRRLNIINRDNTLL